MENNNDKPVFVHLHTHSHYTLLNGLPKVPDLLKVTRKYNMPALAITESGNMYSAIEFYEQSKKTKDKKGNELAPVKAIIGVDFYLSPRTRKDKESPIDLEKTRLVLLAKNFNGYQNLMRLVSASYLEGFFDGKPRIDRELLEKYHQDLIAIMPDFNGELSNMIRREAEASAQEILSFYHHVFADDFYQEITHHIEIAGHEEGVKKIIAWSRQNKVQLVAAHDVYYINSEDKAARDLVVAIGKKKKLSEMTDDEDADFSFISQEQAAEAFKDEPEALSNTVKIAAQCNFEIALGEWKFPNYIVSDAEIDFSDLDPELRKISDEHLPDYCRDQNNPLYKHDLALRKIAYRGIKLRNLEANQEVIDRLEYELKVIHDKGYPQYFLTVADLLQFSDEHNIYTNIRGSVAGSLTTYLTYITKVNPLEFKLPFERFLNPERPSAPDIDMDYADNRRDDVIAYARGKYGDDRVGQIGTFGTMAARGAVKDVTRALGYSYSIGDRLSKMIPMGKQGKTVELKDVLTEGKDSYSPELKEVYDSDDSAKTIIDLAMQIEGNARQVSMHAAGVVIAPGPITDYVPIQFDSKTGDKIITQYEMHAVGEDGVGLLKFDFLGIKNLSILADAVRRIKETEGVEIDIEKIPFDDQKVFSALSRGETMGVFQLGGAGMTKYLMELKPTTMFDINAMLALYRPGPIDEIPTYIDVKHHPEKIKYMDPRMAEYLDQSYGLLVYQDDVMMTAIKLAGYSWLEADKFRKAMGKKIPELMAEQEIKIRKGMKEFGHLDEKLIDTIWQKMLPFASYGFNKAHAASYGHLSYQTAYLKTHYPACYMSAVMTADAGDVEKIGAFVTECKNIGVEILPPDVNESMKEFAVIKENTADKASRKEVIRFGLLTIKMFGSHISDVIIEERNRNGKFLSLEDFLTRITDKDLNKKSLESLIKCGALDKLGERGEMLGNVEYLCEFQRQFINKPEGQADLFGDSDVKVSSLKLKTMREASKDEMLMWEKELLGLYISGHPIDKYEEALSRRGATLKQIKQTARNEQTVVATGLVESIREISTKKGDKMAFVLMRDQNEELEVVFFPKAYQKFKNILASNICLSVKGKFNQREDLGDVKFSVLVDEAKIIDNSSVK